jgi:tetratricopeptide (TPR) repeat protein
VSETANSRTDYNRVIDLIEEDAKAEAVALCRQAIARDPGDVNFVALLGAILLRMDENEEALQVLQRAVSIAPGYPKAQEDLGTVLLNMKRHEEAAKHLLKASQLDDKNADALFKLGGALKAIGRIDDAEQAFKRSIELSPEKGKLAQAAKLLAQRKFREAEKIAKQLLQENPRDINAAILLARIAMDAGCYDDAEVILRKIIQMAPSFIEAWHDLGTSLKGQNKFDEAVEVLERAVQLDSNNAVSHHLHASALAMAAKSEQAELAYKRSIELNPNVPKAYLGLGHVLKTVGRQEEGIVAYRKAMELQPNLAEVHYSLSNLKTFRFTDEEIDDMRYRLEHEQLIDESKVHFAFSLAKAFEDGKDYDSAFEYYARANDAHRASVAYDPVQNEVQNGNIREVFNAEMFEQCSGQVRGCQDAAPIFILGLPRSGSTLLEQILASHSQVDGTSELPDLSLVSTSLNKGGPRGVAYPQTVLDLNHEAIAALGEQYIERTQRHRAGAAHFTDKMPNNFSHIGLIQLILPNAKIIDARRHPLDTCMGCFKQHFAKGQTFTYDLFELGEYYLEYHQMMQHWDEVLPGKVLHVQYEDVVADLERQVRRLLDFCELPFEDSCINFHETERSVRTASSEQVRQPIYSGSINTWQRFEKHLQPLIDILKPILPE